PFVLADPVRGKGLPYLLIHSHLVRASYLTRDLHLPGVPHANRGLPQSRHALGAIAAERHQHADGRTHPAASLTILWGWPDRISLYFLRRHQRTPCAEGILKVNARDRRFGRCKIFADSARKMVRGRNHSVGTPQC